MAINKRNEGAKVNSNINVTPMVDVMLVLLIIFMVITPMLQKGVSVDLAKVNNPTQMPDADKEDALLVAVMRDERENRRLGRVERSLSMTSPPHTCKNGPWGYPLSVMD
jgi:biopolymer transport protein ExbD